LIVFETIWGGVMILQYKEFGRTGVKLSRLGFGTMRLPMTGEGEKSILDYEKSTLLFHKAFSLGVNYVDTAYFYCYDQSETAVGKAVNSWNGKIYVATKCPIHRVKQTDDFWRFLETQINRLNMDCIDFYHFHALNKNLFQEKALGLKLIDQANKAKEQGIIKYLSFSFHDSPEVMKEIADSGYFDSVLCQYNLLDRTNEEAMVYVASKGLGVAVMGPVGGGRLSSPSQVISQMTGTVNSTAEIALRFVLANPDVTVALSGMESMEIIEENATTASLDTPLNEEERSAIQKVLEQHEKLAQLYCTGCKYCLPCPQGIDIPYLFQLMNYHRVYGLTDYARESYAKIGRQDKGKKADACIRCSTCEKKCPQKIEITRQMKEVAEALG
jgi:predicted aldo/keto reductase-like oxidoreductase